MIDMQTAHYSLSCTDYVRIGRVSLYRVSLRIICYFCWTLEAEGRTDLQPYYKIHLCKRGTNFPKEKCALLQKNGEHVWRRYTCIVFLKFFEWGMHSFGLATKNKLFTWLLVLPLHKKQTSRIAVIQLCTSVIDCVILRSLIYFLLGV